MPRPSFTKFHPSRILLACLLPTLLLGCQGSGPAVPTAAALPATTAPAPSPLPALTATPFASPTPSLPAASPTPTAIPVPRVCSPLGGFALEELAGMVVNPYNPPPLGSDDPHQGVDVAERDASLGIALAGTPVQAVLAGQAVLVTTDRFPYGNALMVETPLEDLPPDVLDDLALPPPAQNVTPNPALTCPDSAEVVIPETEARSLYVLYAHMQQPLTLSAGQPVGCGQAIGVTGSSGNALNPHLHLEIRVGPAGMRFPGMAHYDTSASAAEMRAYCEWRTGGAFQTLDPLSVLSILSQAPGQ